VRYAYLSSPLGDLLLTGDEIGLTGLYLPTGKHARTAPEPSWQRDERAFAAAREQLAEYFAGTRTSFELPLHPSGTQVQLTVWAALQEIAYGRTATYGQQAAAIGKPAAARAVGLANGRNPISIVVPCHRVLGADGSLTGYGGGLDAKRWLLEHEAAHADAARRLF
jgi:methylated-DNA-[protein]-cysteine S-methyltransferase